MKQILLLGLLLLVTMRVAGQAQNVDSLENELKTQKLTAKEQMALYQKLCEIYEYKDLEKSLLIAEKGLAFAEKEGHKVYIAKFYDYIGRTYNSKPQYDSASVYYNKALEFAISAKDKAQEACIYTDLGASYRRQYRLSSALEYFLKALSIYEEIGDIRSNRVILLANISTIHQTLKNKERALYYLEEAEKIAKNDDDRMMIYADFGNYYEEPLKRIEYYQKAYKIALTIGNKYYQASLLQSIGAMYYLMDNFDEAKVYSQKALLLGEEFNDKSIIMGAYANMSDIYCKQNKWKECEAAACKAWEHDSTNMDFAYYTLYKIIYSNIYLNNKDKAATYLDKLNNIVGNDTNNDDKLRQSLSEMEVKYETQKKELRITALEKERRLYNWLGIAGGLLVITMGIVLWQYARNAKKERQLIATKALQDGELGERTRIAEDIHDRLGGSLSAVKMGLKNAESLQNVSDKLDGCIKEVREITHNLMPRSLRLLGIKGGLEDFAAQFSNVHFHFFGKDSRIKDRIEFAVYCCASELVTNSLRHSGAENINVQLVQDEKYVSLTVHDDGCGFDEKKIKQGIGLKNIRDRVASYNGKLDIASSPGNGTETTIELKVEN